MNYKIQKTILGVDVIGDFQPRMIRQTIEDLKNKQESPLYFELLWTIITEDEIQCTINKSVKLLCNRNKIQVYTNDYSQEENLLYIIREIICVDFSKNKILRVESTLCYLFLPSSQTASSKMDKFFFVMPTTLRKHFTAPMLQSFMIIDDPINKECKQNSQQAVSIKKVRPILTENEDGKDDVIPQTALEIATRLEINNLEDFINFLKRVPKMNNNKKELAINLLKSI